MGKAVRVEERLGEGRGREGRSSVAIMLIGIHG